MNRMTALFVLLLMAFAPTAFADLTYHLDDLTGDYPGESFQVITFPDDLTGVTTIVGTCTLTGYAGTRGYGVSPDADPEDYIGGIRVYIIAEDEGEVYSFATSFQGPFPSGYTNTLTETFSQYYQPTFHQILAGKTVRVEAIYWKRDGIIESPRIEVHSLDIRLVGNVAQPVVSVKQTSLTTIKALFD